MSQVARDFDFRSAIDALIATFEQAAAAKDVETIANMYAEDATLLPPGSPLIKGRANIRAFWQAFFDAGASDARIRTVEVGSSGDLAYEIGTYQANMPQPQGGVAPGSGKYVVAWRRQTDGSLKMVADIFNEDA
jgi:uncharacterized protein (TIGR02246 family)